MPSAFAHGKYLAGGLLELDLVGYLSETCCFLLVLERTHQEGRDYRAGAFVEKTCYVAVLNVFPDYCSFWILSFPNLLTVLLHMCEIYSEHEFKTFLVLRLLIFTGNSKFDGVGMNYHAFNGVDKFDSGRGHRL